MSAFSVVPEGTLGSIQRLNPAINGWAIVRKSPNNFTRSQPKIAPFKSVRCSAFDVRCLIVITLVIATERVKLIHSLALLLVKPNIKNYPITITI
jgi:hypothetical protein